MRPVAAAPAYRSQMPQDPSAQAHPSAGQWETPPHGNAYGPGAPATGGYPAGYPGGQPMGSQPDYGTQPYHGGQSYGGQSYGGQSYGGQPMHGYEHGGYPGGGHQHGGYPLAGYDQGDYYQDGYHAGGHDPGGYGYSDGIMPAVSRFRHALRAGRFGRGYSPWYASTTVLSLCRNRPNSLWTSCDSDDPMFQLASSDDVGIRWRLGGELRFGRRFASGQSALEGAYWLLDSEDDMFETSGPGHVSVPAGLIVDSIAFNGTPAPAWFDGADSHRIWRTDEIHNVELNFVNGQFEGGYAMGLDVQWMAGVRLFRFKEGLMLGSLINGFDWGEDPAQEAYLDERISNNMIGVQVGASGAFHFGRWRLAVAPKFGLYNNHVNQFFSAYLGDGTLAVPLVPTGNFPVESSDNQIAFLTQIDVSLDFQISCRWSARIGSHLIVISGIGLADNQFPACMANIPEFAEIDFNGELVLYGVSAGVTYNF